jgi:hypothetical protein
MPPTSPATIVATILGDLVANTTLNPTKTWEYVEPTVIPPESCPLLAVSCTTTDYEILTGSAGGIAYERKHTILIGWYVYSADMADTGGVGDPATVAALDAVVETVLAQAATYTAGLPGTSSQMVVTVRSRRLEPKAGAIWAAIVELTAEEAA